ncbi:MAG: HAD-IB family hydrolase [Succinivibrio sp.]|nr:HAD-IB family hydrolase [Succinivibrio sp.]
MSVAFFDMDETLVNGDTNDLSVKYYLKHGLITEDFIRPLPDYHQRFFEGNLDIREFIAYIVQPVLPLSCQRLDEVVTGIVTENILPHIRPGAKKTIAFHKQRGDTTVIVTSTVDFIVKKLSQALQIDAVIAAPVKTTADGCIEGSLDGLVPYQEGKVTLIKQFVRERQLSLEDSYAYGDSINDLPMLLLCDHRFAINPNEGLRNSPAFPQLKEENWD